MYIANISKAHPEHYYDQYALIAEFKRTWSQAHHNLNRVDRIHKAVMVGGRHLALPIEEYHDLNDFTKANDHFIRIATDVGEKAINEVLKKKGLTATDIDAIFFVSVTGIATPSIDAKLCNRLGFRSDIKRIPIFGLGCVAGAAGLSRVHDYLKAYPDQIAILLSVELCSLTLQRKDFSVANLISTGLFGDGGACVLAIGENRAKKLSRTGPLTVASRSRFYPDTEDVMGWKIGSDGFQVILQASVPDLVKSHLQADVDSFLATRNLTRKDIKIWICHTGGPKVINAFQEALKLTDEDIALTRSSLLSVGNLSSASVLFVLADTLKENSAKPGDFGLVLAMGPGFCCEMVLLKW